MDRICTSTRACMRLATARKSAGTQEMILLAVNKGMRGTTEEVYTEIHREIQRDTNTRTHTHTHTHTHRHTDIHTLQLTVPRSRG
jgi:hypothetical protein